jgi:general secretion pathway protein H
MTARVPRRPRSGFTLVEMMVVLVIIGLAATAVVLAMPDPGGSLQGEAERLAARAKAARDGAIVESRPARLRIDAEGYALERRDDGEWQAAARHEWAEATEVEPQAAQTRFDTTGLAEPLVVALRRDARRVEVRIDADGSVHVVR